MAISTIVGKAFYGSNDAQNATFYWGFGGGQRNTSTEARTDVVVPTGAFKQLSFYVGSSLFSSATTFRLRKNAANGNLAASAPAATTGLFSDTSNSDSTTNGDTATLSSTGSSAPYLTNEGWGGAEFETSSDAVTWYMNTSQVAYSSTSTLFNPLVGGSPTVWQSTESDCQGFKTRLTAGNMNNLQIDVSANTNSAAATTFRIRKNTANGNQSASITASTTGSFSDTSNTDSVNNGDIWDCSILSATNNGSVTCISWGCRYTNASASAWDLIGGGVAASNNGSASTTQYGPFIGCAARTGGSWEATEANVQLRWGYSNGKIVFARVRVSASATGNATTYKVRKNTADGNQSISATAASTGWFEDSSNNDTFTTGDLLAMSQSSNTNATQTTDAVMGSAQLASSTEAGTAVMTFAGISFSATGFDTTPGAGVMSFAGISFSAAGTDEHAGTAVMAFNGISLNAQGWAAQEFGTAVMAFNGISIQAVGLDPGAAGSGVRQFWTFGA